MAEILKLWLTERLKRPITWEADEFGETMKNGRLIADILLNYLVIDEDKHYLIKVSNDKNIIDNNWGYLREWLKELDVVLTDSDFNNVKEGKGSTLLRLFYQLFLHLDKRDRLTYIKKEQQKASRLTKKLDHRFNVECVDSDKIIKEDILSKPLVNEKELIEWQRKKEMEIKKVHDYMRHMYLKHGAQREEKDITLKYKPPKPKHLSKQEQLDMQKFTHKYPSHFKNYTYDELVGLKEKADENKFYTTDAEWAQNFVEQLQHKVRDRDEAEKFQTQLSNVITSHIWDQTIEEEEDKYDTDLAKKVMKISQIEKQMCTQIMEVKQQARNLVKNRIEAEKQFAEQREQHFAHFFDNVKEQMQLECLEMDFEKERQDMLHKKLYAEKMRRKRLEYYNICYETMLAIIDYATKNAYYRKLMDDEVPTYLILEWKALFYKNQPVFEIMDKVEDILEENEAEEEVQPEEEVVVQHEVDRQNCMNESEFLDYHNYEHLWSLHNLIPNFSEQSDENVHCEYLGLNILGHVVYTLLEIKYPFPPKRKPAELPNFICKSILRNIPEKSITIPMQILLNHRQIFVARLEAAIYYCLNSYKLEMVGFEDIELPFDLFISLAPEDCKDLVKLVKSEINPDDSLETSPNPNSKLTQTPKTLPLEELQLSPSAELGKYAYEALASGDFLTDYLVSAMLVEYIKKQQNINGFVIINYPNNYREAQVLEEVFSGRAPPDEQYLDDRDEVYLEESIKKQRKVEKDIYIEDRKSKLVVNPHKDAEEPPFTTYFTSYINLKPTEDILQVEVIWHLNEENSELIDRFYACQGINYSMYYEFFEKSFLSQLCTYIIGDFELPLKSTDDLFGMGVLSDLDYPSTDDKRQKSKIMKPDTSIGKLKKGSKTSSKHSKDRSSKNIRSKGELQQESIKQIVESTIIPEESVDILKERQDSNKSKTITIEEVISAPGEEHWVYGNLPIPEDIGTAVASLWEELEKSYIHDIEQLFFSKRLSMNCLIPYARFIKDKMHQIITLPSPKQDIVAKFQQEYNDFESDWRNTNVSKNEWHCRVMELQRALKNICDDRQLFAKKQTQSLIMENWTMDELTSIVNTYISCMQTELNRSVLTFQILQDFYFAMLKRPLSNDRLTSKELARIIREPGHGPKKSDKTDDKLYRQLKAAFIEMQLKNLEVNFSNNPFNMVIENNAKYALKIVKDINDSFRSQINREHTEISKITVPVKPKRDDFSEYEGSVCEEEVFKVNALKCVEEWLTAVNGETCRFNLRIQALQNRCYREMRTFNNHIFKTFADIGTFLNTYYANEIKAVDRICKYFQMAVENSRKIEETLILVEDKFIIDPNLLQFEVPAQKDNISLKETLDDTVFRTSQLAYLRTQFKLVAPSGIILQKDFIYLVQDFIFFGKESCEGSAFPKYWKRIDPDDVPKLVYNVYGEAVYVDWRDFLIFCLNIKYPTVDELLELRKRFRCKDEASTELISRDTFVEQQLWFDEDVLTNCNTCKLALIKHFIFELFEVRPNIMNYTAMLLAFSKNEDPAIGFTTALSMAVGKKICHNETDCERVIQKLIKLKEYMDACKACANRCAKEYLEIILTKVMDMCIGITISEIEVVQPVEEKKKKGKGPAKKKDAKGAVTQSARTPKRKSDDGENKVVQSAINISASKTLKSPNPEPEIEETKLPEVTEEVGEGSVSTEPDPDFAYSVSQEIIWKVLEICLPWPFQFNSNNKSSPYIDNIKKSMKRLQKDTDDGSVYISRLIRETSVCVLLHKMKKFHAINLNHEVAKIIH